MDPIALGMQPHPEGGWYRETWRHELTTPTSRGPRALVTCVSFLLQPGQTSAWHRVTSAELWLWQGGGAVELTLGGLGPNPIAAEQVLLSVGDQYLVGPSRWQTARPADDRAVLVACIVAPGFDFADFELARTMSEDGGVGGNG